MCLLFETIQICNGKAQRIELHSLRMNRSRRTLLHCTDFIDLQSLISIPQRCYNGVYKCRVTYGKNIEDISFTPYAPRIINTLKLVECNNIEYAHKYADRTNLEKIKTNALADDVIIAKNGYITDTSFSNLIFFDGKQWITPATPLLRGTMREYLLNKKEIIEKEIKIDSIKKLISVKVINAMLPPTQSFDIQINNIIL